ncbi:hypothetical protein KFE25_008518 [Diacronema lutheri]|uniref:Monogalactosyldiacylglycerol synthase n=1 Tax=Diacronema lutheri TaxID=2081491 RepID=A0A8J5XWS5_DIALT|nr:hypothetical protein KFE25_008518 [Diacronema lutheri]
MQTSKPTCAEASHVGPASGHLWLASAGGLLTAFIAHRAEVHAGELLLWSTRGASAPPIVAARVIALAGASIFPVGRTGFRSWCFAVVPDGETNGHTFAAASEVELACWLRDLRVVAFELRSVARPRPRRALLLYGRGGGGHLASALAVRDCLAGPLEGRAAAMLAECYAAEARAATVAPAVEASACKAELPAAPPELELVDVGRVVDEIVLGGWLSRALPFGGDDVYNWLLSHGCYALAALGTRLSARGAVRLEAQIVVGLCKLLAARRPAIVVSCVPILNAALRDALLEALPGVQLLTLVTDMASSHDHPWIAPYVRAPHAGLPGTPLPRSALHTVVAGGARLQAQAEASGYPPDQILRTGGMVVHPRFYAHGAVAGAAGASADGRQSIVLAFGSHAPPRTLAITRALLRTLGDRARIVALCGKNGTLHARISKLVGDARRNGVGAARREGWARVLAEPFLPAHAIVSHLRSAACVLGKPGPGMASEAAAMRVPFVSESAHSAVLPQERSVLEWLHESGFGLVLPSLEHPPVDLLERVASCRAALQQHDNRAVFQVAARLRALLDEGRAPLGGPVRATVADDRSDAGPRQFTGEVRGHSGWHPPWSASAFE